MASLTVWNTGLLVMAVIVCAVEVKRLVRVKGVELVARLSITTVVPEVVVSSEVTGRVSPRLVTARVSSADRVEIAVVPSPRLASVI